MKIYLDLVWVLNFFFDLLLLVAVKLLLKRNVSFKRLLLGTFLGSLSIFLLFLKLNNLELFCFKLLISILMLLVSFGYLNIRYFFKNFVSLYIVSAFLGGFLYILNNCFAYKRQGLVFFHKGLSINIIFLVLISPVVIYIYIKENKILKTLYAHYYPVRLEFANGFVLETTGYLDTGNNLIDPVSGKKVIFLKESLVKGHINIRSPIYVPFKTLSSNGLLKCIKAQKFYLERKEYKDILIGLTNREFNLNGVDCILNNQMKGRE